MPCKARGFGSLRSMMSRKLTVLLCAGCFCAGMLFNDRMWAAPRVEDIKTNEKENLNPVSENCNPRNGVKHGGKQPHGDLSSGSHLGIQALDRRVATLEMELPAARAAQDSTMSGSPSSENIKAALQTILATLQTMGWQLLTTR